MDSTTAGWVVVVVIVVAAAAWWYFKKGGKAEVAAEVTKVETRFNSGSTGSTGASK